MAKNSEIKRVGQFELFRGANGEQVLSLDGAHFMLIEGPKGEDMVARRGGVEAEQMLESGEYHFVVPDAKEQESAHLLLKRNGQFQVVIFPQGMPTLEGEPQTYVPLDEDIQIDEVELYVETVRSGHGGERERPATEEEYPELWHFLGGMGFPAERRDIITYVQRRQGTPNVVEELKRLEEGNYRSIDEIARRLHDLDRLEAMDLADYESRSVEEVLEKLEAMEPGELQFLEEYERSHGEREEVMEAIDGRLKGG